MVLLIPVILTAQPQPWDPAVGGGEGTLPVGGGAPIGGGMIIMLSMAAGYAVRKIHELRRKVME